MTSNSTPASATPSEAPPKAPKRRRWLRRTVLAAVAAALMLGLIFGAIQSAPGKNWLAARINALLDGAELKVRVEGISGTVPTNMRVARITVADREGEWLVVEEAALRWRPLALANRAVRVTNLSAARVAVARAPLGAEDTDTADKPPLTVDGALGLVRGLPIVQAPSIAVERLELAEGLLPEAAAFRVDAGLTSESADRRTVHAAISTLDGGATRADLNLSIDAAGRTLALQTAVDEAAGGMVGRLIGAPEDQPMSLRIDAEGPLDALPLSVEADLGATAVVAAAGELRLGDALFIDLEGASMAPPAMRPAGFETLLAEALRYTVHGSYDPDGATAKGEAEVAGAGIDASASATFDMSSKALTARVTMNVADAAVYSEAVGETLTGSLDAEASATGPLEGLAFTFSASSPRLVRGATEIAGLRMTLAGDLAKGADGPDIAVSGEGAIEALRDPGLPALEGTFAEWTLTAGRDDNGLRIEAPLRFPAAGGSVRAVVTADAAAERGVYEANVDLPDTAPLAKLAGLDGTGAVTLTAAGEFDRTEKSATARIAASGSGLSGFHPHLGAVVGEAFTLDADAALAGSDIAVNALTLTSGNVTANGQGTYGLEAKTVDAEFTAAVARLADLSRLAGRSLGGSAQAKGRAVVTADGVDIDVASTAEGFALDGRAFDGLTASLKAAGPIASVAGNGSVALWDNSGRLDARAAFVRDGERWTVSEAVVDGPGLRATGEAVWPGAVDGLTGGLTLDGSDLGALGVFLGMDLDGTAALRAELTADGGQRLDASGTASALRVPGFSAASLTLDAALRSPFSAPSGTGSLQAAGIAAGDGRIEMIKAELNGDGDILDVTAELSASAPSAAEASTTARITFGAAEKTVTVRALDATVDEIPIALEDPAVVRIGEAGISAEPFRLSLGGGAVAFEGMMGADRADFTLRVADLPLALAERFGAPPLAGSAAAELRIEGTPAAPTAALTATIDGLTPLDDGTDGMTPVDLRLAASMTGGALEAEAQALHLGDEPSSVSLSAPAAFSLRPFAFRIDENAPIAGAVALRIDTAKAAALALPADQAMKGELLGDAVIGGTAAAPTIQGAATLEDGYYENVETGTVLSDVRLDALFDGSSLTLRALEVADGAGGSARITGSARLSPSPEFAFEADFDRARLVRLDLADATVDGKASVTGNADGARVEGDLVVSPLTVRIPGSAGPDVPTLEVRDAAADPVDDEAASTPPKYPVDLAVKVSMPGEVYVNGRGLRSEWRGAVSASGPAAAPEIGGRLTIVEGSLDFMSKSFQLVNCAITLDGPLPLDPLVDITAQREQRDLVARLRIIGPSSAPQVRLESEPPMPQDDILAYILFGRPLSDLGPSQALQVVRAARALSGASGGTSAFNVTGHMQQALGLDTLNFDASGGLGEASVGIGKQFSDRIYVEVNQGLGGTGGGVSAAMEVTDEVRIEATSSASGGGGAAIKYKKDY